MDKNHKGGTIMPIFEFVCNRCQYQFEEIMFSSFEQVPYCPQCGSDDVQKLISAGNIRANGIPKGQGGFSVPSCMNKENEQL